MDYLNVIPILWTRQCYLFSFSQTGNITLNLILHAIDQLKSNLRWRGTLYEQGPVVFKVLLIPGYLWTFTLSHALREKLQKVVNMI